MLIKILLTVVMALILPFIAQAAESEKTAQTTISALNKQHPAAGIFSIDGYVVKIYQCPPCPKDALCKPCMRSNVVFSENNKLLESYSVLTDREIIAFIQESKKLELGKWYNALVKITPYNSTGTLMNDIELLSFTPVQ